MKVTKRQAGMLGVLGVALVALAYDQMFSTPKRAGAMVHPPPSWAGGVASAAAAPAGGVAGAGAPASEGSPLLMSNIAARLRGVGRSERDLAGARDAFAVPGAWMAEAPPPAEAAAVVNAKADAFCRAHHLVAVWQQGAASVAVVDDLLVKMGQQVDGFTLTQVGPRQAWFCAGGIMTKLTLDEPQATSQN